ncbi:MAG: ATP-binding protein [Chthoniobacteraceae bacterium]
MKFSQDSGRIVIHTANPTPVHLEISVSDQGIGIEPENLPSLFNAFEQGGRSITRRYGGLGLGLAISKALVELHGGTIRATSEGAQRGSTFTVDLATCAAPAAPALYAMPPVAKPAGPLRILLVEDHASTLQVLTRLLRRAGHDVAGVSSIAGATHQLATSHFDLLISDLGLPDGSGMDLMRALPDRTLPAIALSGYGMEADVRACLAAGFRAHITKPLDWDRLSSMITEFTAAASAAVDEK